MLIHQKQNNSHSQDGAGRNGVNSTSANTNGSSALGQGISNGAGLDSCNGSTVHNASNVPEQNQANGVWSKRVEQGSSANGFSQSHSVAGPAFTNRGPESEKSHIALALYKLNQAHEAAMRCKRSPWDFALELAELTSAGVGTHLLRKMVCEGWIEHQRETTGNDESRRTFSPENDVVFSDRSCFVLSPSGRARACRINDYNGLADLQRPLAKPAVAQLSSQQPVWDPHRRELRLGSIVVKRFKWPAANQERVVEAFEEEGWPKKIDDPLPPNPNIDPKRRLHDTIKCLNRKQINPLIKFRGDGTGEGVVIEILAPNDGQMP